MEEEEAASEWREEEEAEQQDSLEQAAQMSSGERERLEKVPAFLGYSMTNAEKVSQACFYELFTQPKPRWDMSFLALTILSSSFIAFLRQDLRLGRDTRV